MTNGWPQPLSPVVGPFSSARLDGAAAGMGSAGPATQGLIADGFVPPDLITGMTLFLLARQPRQPRSADEPPQKATPIAGGVWVREQFTIHRPLAGTDAFTVTGEATGRYVRKERRYGTTSSSTHNSAGALVATNLTTGLLSYKVEPGRSDEVIGIPLDQTPAPMPDPTVAANNPHLDALANVSVGDRFGGDPVTMALSMMAARDTENPDNPIHSDLDEARKAGLARPIAGGSHVLAFAIEPLLASWGSGALSHGTHFDVRWRAPTEADVVIEPAATITEVTAEAIIAKADVALSGGPVAMVATITVPRAGATQ